MSIRKARAFSFEFFPPKDDQSAARLKETTRILAPLRPQYVSVTFGAGGTTRDGTYQAVRHIQESTGLEVVPHLSCLGTSREALQETLERYKSIGVKRIVALRGDKPQGGQPFSHGPFKYGSELVAFIRQFGGFSIAVGCYPEFHPESPDPVADLRNFVRKVEAGADQAISQYFFNNDAYYAFVDSVRRLGCEVPIHAGLMPITDFKQIARFSSFCGADIPAWIRKRMEGFAADPASQKAFGIEIATRQAEDLLRQGCPGIHFYTLNKAEATLRIWKNLGLFPAPSELTALGISAQAV
ncbi:MAG TPA: methylenetetrahydrofolate reductase [NAD(P)H] [Polyangiaceae bacterium]|nr:methylenetetrahydrofolate reductase [NAD(P)H] [Polyangiaceae bacterium]